jgi:hypothetical protein
LVDGSGDRVAAGLTALDFKLSPPVAPAEREGTEPHHRSQLGMPVATDALPSLLVHETLIALAAEWRRGFPRAYSVDGFRLPIEPGPLAPHLDAAAIEGMGLALGAGAASSADGESFT